MSEEPTGYFDFEVPGAYGENNGIGFCKSEGLWQVYAVMPIFNSEACEEWVKLKGLGTLPYTGMTPPVWAYS